MRKLTETITDLNINYEALLLPAKENVIFLDIETTGLSSRNSFIYMIGLAYYNASNFEFCEILADNAAEELDLLKEFINIINKYNVLIHFNGNRFDIPFIKDRCKANGLSLDISIFDNIDLYKLITPYKQLFNLPNCKQKTIECFMGINRQDNYSGGELINVYKEYSSSPSEELYNLLYQHNRDDVVGMLQILPILNYNNLFEQEVNIINANINTYNDYYGELKKELLIEFSLTVPVHTHISFNVEDIYGSFKNDKGIVKVPVYQEKMKLFYDNYKDYYYLPAEDIAIHKSVSEYVDKEFRRQATAKTCYTKYESEFLPQWDTLKTPFFRRDYNTTPAFFEFNEEIKTDEKFLSVYTSHLLKYIISISK